MLSGISGARGPWRSAGGMRVGTSEAQDLSLRSTWGGSRSEVVKGLHLELDRGSGHSLSSSRMMAPLRWGTSLLPRGTRPSSYPCPQVPLLPERVHTELLLRVVGLGPLGAGDRLDGAEWHQPGTGLEWPGGHLAAGACPPHGPPHVSPPPISAPAQCLTHSE